MGTRRKLSMLIRCAGRKPLKLEPGQRLRVGRQASNDLVLNDGSVSRFHAALVWDPDEDRPYVRDNESANGVEVNGQPIEDRRHLNGGDTVGIGSFTLSLELRQDEPQDSESAALASGSDDEVTLFTDKGKERQGEAEDQRTLQRLFLELEEEKRTGTLQLSWEDQTAVVLFSQGKIMGVEAGKVSGREGLKRLLKLGRAKFHFSKALRPTESALELSVREFLSEELGVDTHRLRLQQ